MPGYFSPSLRRRLAPAVLVIGLLLFGKLAHEEIPRAQEVRFVLTPELGGVRAVRVTYAEGGEPLTGMERRFPEGAPREFSHRASLRPGRYDLAIEITQRDGQVSRLSRALEVPAETTPRIVLRDEGP